MPDMRLRVNRGRKPPAKTWLGELRQLAQEVDAVCQRKLVEFRKHLNVEWSPVEQLSMIRSGRAALRPDALAYGPLVEQYEYPVRADQSAVTMLAEVVAALDAEALTIKQAFMDGDLEGSKSRLAALMRWSPIP